MTSPSRTTVPRSSMNQASSNLTEEESEARNSCEINSPVKEQKRQKILAIARKEEEDYKKYKESIRLNNVCETPRATGGVLPREEVIKKYETQVKTAKYKAKIRKDTYKEEQKRIEEEKINAKKEAARSPERNAKEEIKSLPGQYRLGLDQLKNYLAPIVKNGLKTVLLFASMGSDPKMKNDVGSTSEDGEINPVIPAVKIIKEEFPLLTIACDVCLCGYTTHGHCGALDEDGMLDNERSIKQIAQTSLAYVRAGCHVLAPSDMNDGRIQAIDKMLKDIKCRNKVNIMSYSAKFSSCLYGPFRDAAGSAPKSGDRKCYQLPPGSSGLAIRAIERDVKEAADILMVKPAMLYMDIIKEAKTKFPDYPVAAYQVSGEFAMLYHASMNGALDLKSAVLESLVSLHRAGADILITYYTPSVLEWLKE